ncbi:MAG: RHS repeat domain-containing protein [Candidatus Rokuibacteriota bacterium]
MRRAIAFSLPFLGLLAPLSLPAQSGSMRVSLPSPTVASLGKFGDVPVSLYTGVPDISIPLFTAKGRTLELPIGLKYHAGGIKVEEIGGWVGLGWTLEAGGAITRTVRGLVDEIGNGYYNTGHTFWTSGNWPDPTSGTLLANIRNELLDGEPDQFFFSFAGRSGQFVMGPTSTSTTIKEYRAIQYQKLRIEPFFGIGGSLASWVITAEDGTRYTLDAVETSIDWSTTSDMGEAGSHYGQSYTSAWNLTEIRSPGGDVITLQYSPYTVRHKMGRYREKFDQRVASNPDQCVPDQYDVFNEYEISVQRLASITTAAHTVTFSPGTTLRSDALWGGSGVPQEPRLEKITVATPTGTVLRAFQFEHDYSIGRLTLKNVYEQDRNGVSLPPYSFTYSGPSLPALTSYALDHWGYYNGKTSNTTPIPPAITPGGASLPGADRNPDSAFMRAGVLTRVTYPTGGYTEFVYEANDYGGVGGGGTIPEGESPEHVAYVASWSFQGSVTQEFTVGGTQPVVATAYFSQDPTNCARQEDPPCPITEIVGVAGWQYNGSYPVTLTPGTYTLRASDEFSGGYAEISVHWREWGPLAKKPAGGLRVAEVRAADAMGNLTTRKYKYTLQSDTARSSGLVSTEPKYAYQYSSATCSYFSRSSMSRMPLGGGAPVGYREVAVWHGVNGEFGKTRHTFRSALVAPDPPPPNSVWPFSTRTSYEWKRGQPLGATEYNAAGQTQHRVAMTHTFPNDSATDRKFRGMSINYFSSGTWGGTYVYNAFEVISGWGYQDSDTTVVYDETGVSSFSTARKYVYGNLSHIQLSEQTDSNSTGTQRITRMKYPADFAPGSGNAEAIALTAMQGTSYMHSPVIERWVVEKVGATETVVQAEVTSFKMYLTGQYLPYQRFVFNSPSGVTNFVPSSVTTGAFTKDSRYLRQETADTYDGYGRITQLTDTRDNVTTYLYGGNPNNAFLTQVARVGSPSLVTDLAYDTDGFLASIKDEGGSFKHFTYDLYGRLRLIKNHSGTPVKAFGYVYSRTSPSWNFDVNNPNRVVDTTFLQQTPTPKTVVSTEYLDGLGRPRQTVLQDGTSSIVTATEYDAMGRLWRSWKPYRRPTSGYDGSFATTATDSANAYYGSPAKPYVETQYRADALNRVSKVIPEYIGSSPSIWTVTSYGVEAAPVSRQITELTDESGKKQRSFTDVFGNTVKTILGYGAPEATTTQLLYNVLGQRTQATDPRNLNTMYALDTRGLLTSKTSPDAGTVSHKYDKAGNLRYTQDANQAAVGTVYFTTYDFADRPLVSGLGTASFASLDPNVTNTFETTETNWLVVRAYDAKPTTGLPWNRFPTQISALTLNNVSGRLAAVGSKSNGAWQVTLFSYDADGQVAMRYTYTEANGGASVLTAVNTTDSYTHDLRGALTQRSTTVGSSTFYHWYDYDNRGLLWKVFASTSPTKPGTPDVTYGYRPSGQVQDRQFAGGPVVPLKYTIREQLQSIGDPGVTTYPFSARYTYHPNQTLLETEFYNGGSPAVEKRYKYWFGGTNYDALNRLKGGDFTHWSGGTWSPTAKYDLGPITYDAAGNLLTLQRRQDAGTVVDNLMYAIAANSNRLTSVSEAVDGSPETWDAEDGSFTYDANGNVKTATGAPYSISTPITYDHQNLALSITRSGITSTYRYNEAGQRITKQVGTGNTEVYLLDGAASLGVFTVNGAGTPTSWYFNIVGGGEKVIGRQPNTGNRRYYHTDILGSTRAVVEGATVVESYDFEPWGLLMAGRTLAGPTKEGFTGKEQDAETGFDYFGARYYMPALARWTGVDPLAEKHLEWSPYNYVLGNPLTLVDPDGRQIDVKATNSYWENVAIAGHQKGGVGGFLQAAVATAALTVIEYGGLNAMDAGTDAMAYDGNYVGGGAQTLVGVLSLAPLPGGKAAGAVDDVARGGDDLARVGGQLDNSAPATRLAPDAAQPGGGGGAPDFVVTSQREAIPVPSGATGPQPTASPGVKYTGGSGGHGLDPRVSNVRIMEPTARYPGGRVTYQNAGGQGVNPQTGRTIPNSDPKRHIPLKPREGT